MNLNFEQEAKLKKRKMILRESLIWLVEIILVILLAYAIIHICFKRTSTVGSVMEPTLYNGEEVIINTKAYLLFSPDREDIIAFYDKEDRDDSLILFRRVIGLPGEKIRIEDGKIRINGEEWKEKYPYAEMTTSGIAEEEITLGEDEYFVLCDSRIDSDDSRNAEFGNVKKSQIIGKVSYKFKPFSVVTGPENKPSQTKQPKE